MIRSREKQNKREDDEDAFEGKVTPDLTSRTRWSGTPRTFSQQKGSPVCDYTDTTAVSKRMFTCFDV